MNKPGCSLSLDGMVALTIVLVVLKAFGKIGCSWLWVFAPLWIPVVIVIAVFVIWLLVNCGGKR